MFTFNNSGTRITEGQGPSVTAQALLTMTDFSRSDILSLLALQDPVSVQQLFSAAEKTRQLYFGNKIHLRGIIEFSNYCAQDCVYCGIRRSNNNLGRYRLTPAQILTVAENIVNAGIKTIVLQSGEDFYYSGPVIADIISGIHELGDVAVTLSLGERKFQDYDLWIAAGADRYLLKHETASPGHYSRLHNGQRLSERLHHIRYLKSIGFQTGSGNIIGFPGQTLEDIADDLLLCQELDLDMASFSPFVPSSATPLAAEPACGLELTLKTMAVARLLLKNVHIPATTALATIAETGREQGILAGANVVMPSFTPSEFRNGYAIYDNKKCISEDPAGCLPCLRLRLLSVGTEPSLDKGHSLKLGLSLANNFSCSS